jgi:hypothetical protein
MSPTPAGLHLRRVRTATAIAALAVGASLFGTRAALAFVAVPEVGTPGYLALHAVPAQLHFGALSPGSSGFGQVRVGIADADSAQLSLQAFATGDLFEHSTGVSLITRLCDVEWQNVPTGIVSVESPAAAASCAAGEMPVVTLSETQVTTDGAPAVDVGSITAGDHRYLLLEAHLPPVASPAEQAGLMGLTGDFAVRVTAEGDGPDDTPPATMPPGAAEPGVAPGGDTPQPGTAAGTGTPDEQLATTGFDAIGAALCALGAIAIGLFAWRRRLPTTETDWPA